MQIIPFFIVSFGVFLEFIACGNLDIVALQGTDPKSPEWIRNRVVDIKITHADDIEALKLIAFPMTTDEIKPKYSSSDINFDGINSFKFEPRFTFPAKASPGFVSVVATFNVSEKFSENRRYLIAIEFDKVKPGSKKKIVGADFKFVASIIADQQKEVSFLAEPSVKKIAEPLKQKSGSPGIYNEGKSSYMNSVLQSLSKFPEFVDLVLSEFKKRDRNGSDIYGIFRALASDMQTLKSSGKPFHSKLAPLLPKLSTFDMKNQSDAFDFYLSVIILLSKNSPDRINELFEVVTELKLTCLSCETITSKKLDKKTRFKQIPIVSHNGKEYQTLKEAFSNSISTEKKIGASKCQNCKETDQLFQQEISVVKYPRIAVIQLERFKKPIKDTHFVDFQTTPPELSQYELVSVIKHEGDSIESGHFVSYAKNGDDWVSYNDDKVSKVATEEVMKSEAYMLFYSLKQNK